MTVAVALLPDPSPRFEAATRAAAARMAGLPIVNPALAVEAVGFVPWEGCWLGIVVAPWFMNLVLAPRDPAVWQPLARGEKRKYHFPAGTYDFIGARDDVVGEHLSCALFSPMDLFGDQPTAVLTAKLALAALFDAAHAPAPEPPPGESTGRLDAIREAVATPMSKRDFLRARFLDKPRESRG
jgi:[NiFe] hydrogenase assembly HybE family chaperone